MSNANPNRPERSQNGADVITLGLTLSTLFLVTFAICLLLGFVATGPNLHQLLSVLFPGFEWLDVGSILIGIFYSLIYGWYLAIAFTLIRRFYAWLLSRAERR